MPVTPARRIAAPVGPSLYDLIKREALSSAWSRNAVARTGAKHPELLLERDGNLLVGLEGGALAYSFRGDRAFIDHFEPMLEQLLLRLRRAFPDAQTASFRLTHNPSRPTVEPILKRLWFSPRRSWLLFSLDRKAPLPRATAAGVKFREGTLADLDEIVRIDDECFPNTPISTAAMRANLKAGEQVLMASVGSRDAGFALFRPVDEDGCGYLSVLAVSDAFRGRGIGEALTVRVAKRLFADGAQTVDLRTDEDNTPAIRLYVKLGFRQTQAGRDYARPLDPRAIARLKKANEGTLIRFGGWR
jgi:ribosomal protein S18 acetylase RimI-like enzyme